VAIVASQRNRPRVGSWPTAFFAIVLAGSLLAGCARALPGAPTGGGSAATAEPATGAPAVLGGEVRLAALPDRILVGSATGIYALDQGRLAKIAENPDSNAIRSEIAALADGRLALATSDGATVVLYASGDQGRTWSKRGSKFLGSATGIAGLDVAAIGRAVLVLANEASGSNVSRAVLALSNDGGATWSAGPAPLGGTLTAAGGAYWLIGGVMGDEVRRSADGATWQTATLPMIARYWTADRPVDVAGLGTVLAVTTHNPTGGSRVSFLVTDNGGKSWVEAAAADGPLTEFGTVIPSAVSDDGTWTVVYVDGSRVVSGSLNGGQPVTRSPNGLPPNVVSLVAEGSLLTALAALSSCPSGKSSCTAALVVVQSADGGQTWSVLE
jgi:hypothetical protein